MKSEMETIQILSSKLREEELENERLRRERDMESEKALRAAEDARVARESAEQYRAQLEEERRAQGDRIESMLKEVMMFITGKGTASLSESLSDSIIKKMHEQHAKELADQKAADEERFRKMDEEHRIREAALESRIRELEDIGNNYDGHDQGAPGEDSQKHFHTLEEAEAAYLNEKRKNDDLNRLRFAQSTEGKYAGRTVVDADAADMKGEDAPDSTYDNVPPEAVKELDILKGEKSAPDAWKHPGLYEAVDYAIREWAGIQNYLLTGSGDYTNNICEREMRIVATLRNNSLFWGSHTSAERLSVILTIVRSALMNCLNVYQYIVYCLKTIRCYKGDLADLLANKWKPSEAALVPILA